MPTYRVHINGQSLDVNSPSELSDYEVYMLAKRQMGDVEAPTGDRYQGPDTFQEGFDQSLRETGGQMLSGFGRGVRELPGTIAGAVTGPLQHAFLDVPRNAADPIGAIERLLRSPFEVMEGAQQTLTDTTDPEKGAAMIPGLLAGLVLPRLLGTVPAATRGTGRAVQWVAQGPRQMLKKAGAAIERAGTPTPRPSAAPPANTSAGTPAPTPAAPPAATPPRVPQTTADLVLTSEERQALSELMKQGYSRKRVMQRILQQRQQGASPTAKTALEAPKAKLNAAEAKEFQRLKRAGKTDAEAIDLIRQMKSLQERFGLPTSEQTRRAVYDRNTSGRWPDE